VLKRAFADTGCVDEATAKEGFRLAAQKIGIKTKFVTRVRAL